MMMAICIIDVDEFKKFKFEQLLEKYTRRNPGNYMIISSQDS